jgi:hypothetical protein
MTGAITIRSSTPADLPEMHYLAQLDGAPTPSDALLAFVDGELRVAVDRADGRAVAHPFHLTADLVELVRTRALQEQPRRGGSHGRLSSWLAPVVRGEARA